MFRWIILFFQLIPHGLCARSDECMRSHIFIHTTYVCLCMRSSACVRACFYACACLNLCMRACGLQYNDTIAMLIACAISLGVVAVVDVNSALCESFSAISCQCPFASLRALCAFVRFAWAMCCGMNIVLCTFISLRIASARLLIEANCGKRFFWTWFSVSACGGCRIWDVRLQTKLRNWNGWHSLVCWTFQQRGRRFMRHFRYM